MTAASPGRLKSHQSIAWAAIAKHADAERERTSLPIGSHVVDLVVSGVAGGKRFSSSIAGTLHVAADGVRQTSEAAPAEHIIAWLLNQFCRDDPAKRARVLNDLPQVWQDEFATLAVAEVDQAKELLSRLRARTGTAEKKGDVRFAPQPAA